MPMLRNLDLIMSMEVGDVIASPLSLEMLRIYSVLYLGGGQPMSCATSQRKYYEILKKDYMKNKEKLEKTHELKFQGLRYIPGIRDKEGNLIAGHLHIVGSAVTDDMALEYLSKGILKEKDFITLPEGYKATVKKTQKEDKDSLY